MHGMKFGMIFTKYIMNGIYKKQDQATEIVNYI
jgi:hypothetical protein